MDKTSKINLVQQRLANIGKYDCNVFKEEKNVVVKSEDSFFEIITFGKNAIIRADISIYDWSVEQFSTIPACEIMDGENLFLIETKLREFGKKLAGEHVRYLYLDNNKAIHRPSDFEYRLFDESNMNVLYKNKGFNNALSYKDDVIAIGAYHENQFVALAGADDRLLDLWQIGIDTLLPYRNNGLASYLVKTLADEIEKRGALPYYTTWSPNLASTVVALKAGFLPVWVGYYSKDI